MSNSLAAVHPELIAEWSEKNIGNFAVDSAVAGILNLKTDKILNEVNTLCPISIR